MNGTPVNSPAPRTADLSKTSGLDRMRRTARTVAALLFLAWCGIAALIAAGKGLEIYPRVTLWLDATSTVAIALSLGWWASLDARIRGRSLPLILQHAIVLIWPVVVPCYVLCTRRWRGLGYLLLFFVLALIIHQLTVSLTYWYHGYSVF